MAQWVKSLVMQVYFPRTYVEGSSPVPQSCPQTSSHHTHINVDSNVSRESTFGLPVLLAAIHIWVTYRRIAKPDDQSEKCMILRNRA